ncbi:hypothetical protein ACQY0O_006308 [Thecaphora frezii]
MALLRRLAPAFSRIARPLALAATPRVASAFFSSSATLRAVREYDADEMRARRDWIARFSATKLQRHDFDVSFARSSGPGGQNVNKLNTKAEVRLDLKLANDSPPPPGTSEASPRAWLNKELAGKIAKKSLYYVASSHSLLVTSMRHRTQEANLQDALEKMHAHILELASEGIVGETSEEQRKRVRMLEAAEQRRKKTNKIKRSDVKSGRKFKG